MRKYFHDLVFPKFYNTSWEAAENSDKLAQFGYYEMKALTENYQAQSELKNLIAHLNDLMVPLKFHIPKSTSPEMLVERERFLYYVDEIRFNHNQLHLIEHAIETLGETLPETDIAERDGYYDEIIKKQIEANKVYDSIVDANQKGRKADTLK